ncbi:hypothetical protein GCM10009609_23620 [Pseudonocardia aurantiaca]|uniref:DUF4267 domain-containing protein n=1 Tax=Pseudonocardia aurantiaca TaxID=75290 RepID=A0ABW4FF88_9PSEU
MKRDQARQLAEAIAWVRIAIGVTALVAPTVPLRPWVGRDVAWQAKLLARSLGARDLALGIGLVLALRHDAPVRGWVEGGGVADAGDALATLLSFGKLPKGSRWPVLLSAAGAAASARLVAPAIDEKV